MGLSLLGVTFSSTIISCCTCNFGCADVRGGGGSGSRMVVMVVVIVHMVMVMVMMVVMDLQATVKVYAAVYLLIPRLALEARLWVRL